jgi:hypothetical protein
MLPKVLHFCFKYIDIDHRRCACDRDIVHVNLKETDEEEERLQSALPLLGREPAVICPVYESQRGSVTGTCGPLGAELMSLYSYSGRKTPPRVARMFYAASGFESLRNRES